MPEYYFRFIFTNSKSLCFPATEYISPYRGDIRGGGIERVLE